MSVDIVSQLFRLGVTTMVTDIVTVIPATSNTKFDIGKVLQENIGFIYGLSIYADGVDEQGNTLISTAQAQSIYITFKNGATEFIETIRLDDLLNVFAGTPVVRPQKFTQVNIPVFDLSKSFYQNPLGLGSGLTIKLKLWYIDKKVAHQLELYGKK